MKYNEQRALIDNYKAKEKTLNEDQNVQNERELTIWNLKNEVLSMQDQIDVYEGKAGPDDPLKKIKSNYIKQINDLKKAMEQNLALQRDQSATIQEL